MQNLKVIIIGGGVMGSQVAYQCSYCGLDTYIWLRSDYFLEETDQKLKELEKHYMKTVEDMKNGNNWENGISTVETFDYEKCKKSIDNAYKSIKISTDLISIIKDADVIFELIQDNIEEKIALYKSLAKILPEKTILVTGSSMILPSKLSKYLLRQDKFIAARFSNPLCRNNICEIMAGPRTSNNTYNFMLLLSKQINTVSIPVRKENNGYIVNAMLMPLLMSALDMVVRGISDFESIDKSWKIGTGAVFGPFEMIDYIGIEKMHNFIQEYKNIPSFLTQYNYKAIDKLLMQYIEDGKIGVDSKAGFYRYK